MIHKTKCNKCGVNFIYDNSTDVVRKNGMTYIVCPTCGAKKFDFNNNVTL